MKIMLSLIIFFATDGICSSLIDPEESSKEYTKDNEVHRSRPKRSLATLLDAWIGTIAVTGIRFSYFPEKWYYDAFGDKEQEAREELDRIIADEHEQHRILAKSFNDISNEYDDKKANGRRSVAMLKNQYKEDFKATLEVIDKTKMLEILCGDTYCKEYLIRDLLQDQSDQVHVDDHA